MSDVHIVMFVMSLCSLPRPLGYSSRTAISARYCATTAAIRLPLLLLVHQQCLPLLHRRLLL